MNPLLNQKLKIPEELFCMVCKELLQDAVMIPCCGNSFCDECVCHVLLESNNHECPECHETDVSPNTLRPNLFLRTEVLNFKNETGYTRMKKTALVRSSPAHIENVESPQPSLDSTVENQPTPADCSPLEIEKLTVKEEIVCAKSEIPPTCEERAESVPENTDGDTSEPVISSKQSIGEDTEDIQPGTPLADEPPAFLEHQPLLMQAIGPEQNRPEIFDNRSSNRYNRNYRDDYHRRYKEETESSEPKLISTIEAITTIRKAKMDGRKAINFVREEAMESNMTHAKDGGNAAAEQQPAESSGAPWTCSGIGLQIMQKMGFQNGRGLGKNLQGRLMIIPTVQRPRRRALGYCGPENMQRKWLHKRDQRRYPKKDSIFKNQEEEKITEEIRYLCRRQKKKEEVIIIDSDDDAVIDLVSDEDQKEEVIIIDSDDDAAIDLVSDEDQPDVKRSTGIPRSIMVPGDGSEQEGALRTSYGDCAAPIIDSQVYKEVKKVKSPFVPQVEPVAEPKAQIPEKLLCMACKDLLQDAVLISFCGHIFCDECVRQVQIESDNLECPKCHKTEASSHTLIPYTSLREEVMNYKNKTGYTRVKKIALVKSSPTHIKNLEFPQPSLDSTVENQPTHSDSYPHEIEKLTLKEKIVSVMSEIPPHSVKQTESDSKQLCETEDSQKDAKKADDRRIDDKIEAFRREEKRDRGYSRDHSFSRIRSSGQERSRTSSRYRSYSSSKSWSRYHSRCSSRPRSSRSRPPISSRSRSRSYSPSRPWSNHKSYTRSCSRTRTKSRSRTQAEPIFRRRKESRDRVRSPHPRSRSRSYSPRYSRHPSRTHIYDKKQRPPCYEEQQEYQKDYPRQHPEVITHRTPGDIGDRSRDYNPRYRQAREPRRENVKELPQIPEQKILRIVHTKESVEGSSSKKKYEEIPRGTNASKSTSSRDRRGRNYGIRRIERERDVRYNEERLKEERRYRFAENKHIDSEFISQDKNRPDRKRSVMEATAQSYMRHHDRDNVQLERSRRIVNSRKSRSRSCDSPKSPSAYEKCVRSEHVEDPHYQRNTRDHSHNEASENKARHKFSPVKPPENHGIDFDRIRKIKKDLHDALNVLKFEPDFEAFSDIEERESRFKRKSASPEVSRKRTKLEKMPIEPLGRDLRKDDKSSITRSASSSANCESNSSDSDDLEGSKCKGSEAEHKQ